MAMFVLYVFAEFYVEPDFFRQSFAKKSSHWPIISYNIWLM